ncbi:MAG: hypothetical protein Ct9H300mP6_05800 [Gammaproteobacteria bacterium]|nr:MAG: hypothetical protein Ct9H300mP6_05800 [Gammaproteobacteria bacterium]
MHPNDLFFQSEKEIKKIKARCSVLIQPEKLSDSDKSISLNFNTEPINLRMAGKDFPIEKNCFNTLKKTLWKKF